MFLVPPKVPQHQRAFVENQSTPSPPAESDQFGDHSSGANVGTLLSSLGGSMERSAPDYPQSGLPSPYPSNFGDAQSEPSADHTSAATYPTQHEVRSTYSTSATPTSEYGVYPSSARSANFDHSSLSRSYHPASNHSGSSGGMAQATSPSMPLQDGSEHETHQVKSDSELPIDPSIAATSPTYSHNPYSPYAAPGSEMSHPAYQHPSSAGLYSQRPDWTGYSQHGAPITPGAHVFSQNASSAAPQHRPNQIYSFVPIPGAQQHKRPRRRYEEIERMYKCGWNGCEKAYGTLNHLNAHVTMQAHGTKRTPEEFKEIRKEWKARKKQEEADRKAADEERQRQAMAATGQGGGEPGGAEGTQPPASYTGSRAVQLPPIGYQPTQYPAPPSAGLQQSSLDYSNPHQPLYNSYSPASPYTSGHLYGQSE